MRPSSRFELLPIDQLYAHEEVDPEEVAKLVRAIRSAGVVEDPIWVARGTGVVLNGHHRLAALRALHAHRVPAWVLDYKDPSVGLDRWSPGPPISKTDVIRRAHAGELFPPKTTRHTIPLPPERHRIPLAELLAPIRATARPTAISRPQPERPRSSRGRAGSSRGT
ncbi:MAG: ParB N-terminal domain-containing protein [Thermoplasmata archaeon]